MTTETDRSALVAQWRWQADAHDAQDNVTNPTYPAAKILRKCADELEALSSSGSSETPRMFPVQNGPDIPWSIIAPFEKQAQRQHHQTLERLAERQGLCVAEVLSVIEGEGNYRKYWTAPERNEHDTTTNILRLCAIVTERSAASSDPQEERPASGSKAVQDVHDAFENLWFLYPEETFEGPLSRSWDAVREAIARLQGEAQSSLEEQK